MKNKNPSFNELKILNEKEKNGIIKKLNEQFGINEIPGIIVKRGTERLFLFQGDFSKQEIKFMERTIPIERVGVYFAKIFKERTGKEKIRLSIEGTQILKKQIKKNIFELNEEQMEKWMKGQELLISTQKKDFLVMKYNDNFLGTGKASEKKITNFIPKNRRLKEKN